MDTTLSADERADLVLAQLALDEKIGLVHGISRGGGGATPDPAIQAVAERSNGGAGFVPGVPRLGLPDLQMADAAVGVARGAARGRYSTALPSTVAEAASWDVKLAYDYGALVGRELRDQGYNVSLGGGVNLLREPRNGRNFEYHGEDPVLAGTMVGHVIKGLQDQHVVGDIKHYALNDQETGRQIASVALDKRVMRETDLLAFEIGIKVGNPNMVMCSYNRVGGDWACEHSYLLGDLLKKVWGFKGWVISDWGATHSTAKAALAGLDQEMPGDTYFGAALRTAVEAGEVPMARLDDMVRRILRAEFASGIIDDPPVSKVPDVFEGFAVAQRAAEAGAVLLKNVDAVLPLGAATVKSIAVIGSHADAGVPSGGGSAQVDAAGGSAVKPPEAAGAGQRQGGMGRGATWHPSAPLAAIRARAPRAKVAFDDGTDSARAAALAKASDVAIVFAAQVTSEGRDMPNLSLPDNQDQLIAVVAAANPRTIVVLETGGPVTMPWIDRVPAVLEAWFPGIRGAEAIANILFGDVNPSGKLPMTFPKTEADLPTPVLPGSDVAPQPVPAPAGALANAPRRTELPPFDITYTEGLKVGYKWFDTEKRTPLFAFGHGLSYTTFAYSGLEATRASVTFTVKNTGTRAGADVAQVYAGLPAGAGEPPRRLVAWEKIALAPGESKTVTLALDPFLLSIFDSAADAWRLVPGDYTVCVGTSSRDTPLTATVRIGG
jgi:beta-glucosidase